MTKTFRKAIMKRSKLKIKFIQERNGKHWSERIGLKESKTRHFSNLNVKDVTKNKRFWKTIKPFFIGKTKNSKTKLKNSNNSILTENFQTIREDEKICKIFNTYFTNVTKGLKLRQVGKTKSFKNEENCGSIKEHFGNGVFSFKPVSKNDIISAIKPYGFQSNLIFPYGLVILSQNTVITVFCFSFTVFSFICEKRFYSFPKTLVFSYIFNISNDIPFQ